MPLKDALQVVVRDSEGKPVSGAKVDFSIRAGGGWFDGGSTTFTATTNPIGVASANFICGTRTDANPGFWWEQGKKYPHRVGENIVSARLRHAGTQLMVPFTAYGFPGEPASIEADNVVSGSPLTWVGTIYAKVFDQYQKTPLPMKP